jgi:hypothetical protein
MLNFEGSAIVRAIVSAIVSVFHCVQCPLL